MAKFVASTITEDRLEGQSRESLKRELGN